MRLELGHAPLLYESAALLGHALYLLKLGRARRVRWRGQTVWCKQRHFYAPLIITCGNALSRLFHCGVYGLPHEAWLAWEETLSLFCGDGQTWRDGRHLMALPMSGVPLRQLLSNEKQENARVALRAALQELHRLHHTKMRFPCGTFALWSHGDAHAGNVFFDVETGKAQWFDFESVHDLCRASAERHASDLQTLLFSAAVYLPEKYWLEMLRVAREIYDEDEVWLALKNSLERLEKSPDLVHLGHVHLNRATHARFTQLLKGVCR